MRHGQFLSIISAFSLSVLNADFKFAAFLYKMWDISLLHILSTNLVSINFFYYCTKKGSNQGKIGFKKPFIYKNYPEQLHLVHNNHIQWFYNTLHRKFVYKQAVLYATYSALSTPTVHFISILYNCTACYILCIKYTYYTFY